MGLVIDILLIIILGFWIFVIRRDTLESRKLTKQLNLCEKLTPHFSSEPIKFKAKEDIEAGDSVTIDSNTGLLIKADLARW